jgi:hypothetical protein
MTEIGAILAFFGEFATAYASDNVPDSPTYPYLTVEPRVGFFDDGEIPVQVQLWHRTESDAEVNEIARQIGRAIGYGGVTLACDTGWVWIKRGTPFVVPVTIETDDAIKRRLINVSIEYITE